MDGARAVCPQHSSRPSTSVITNAFDGVGPGRARDEPLPTGPADRRAAHPHLGGIQQTDRPRWFLDGTQLAQLVADNRIGRSTAYGYLHKGINALAAAPGCAARCWLPAPPGTRA